MHNTRTNPPRPERERLHHELPLWVKNAPNFFITICCNRRDENQLCTEPAGRHILDAAKHYSETGIWFVHILLLMPDHLHAILCLPSDGSLQERIAGFKRFTARATGIEWQKGFFDHRLRSNESLEEKAHYIAMNPVRKSLVTEVTDWKWVYRSMER